MGKHEEMARIVVELKRHGFTQLRKTTHGWLYGFQTFRYVLPHHVEDNRRSTSVSSAWDAWDTLRAEVLAANPGMKGKLAHAHGDRPADVEALQSVFNPDDLVDLETERSEPAASPSAPEGSTPSGLPPPDGAARLAPADPSGAREGSTPSGSTPPHPPQEDRPMATATHTRKDGRRMPTSWTCPKCGKVLKAAGLHPTICGGTQGGKAPKPPSGGRRGKAVVGAETANGTIRRSSAPVVLKPTDYLGIVEAFQGATTALVEGFKALVTERDHYRTERDDLNKKFEGVRSLFK